MNEPQKRCIVEYPTLNGYNKPFRAFSQKPSPKPKTPITIQLCREAALQSKSISGAIKIQTGKRTSWAIMTECALGVTHRGVIFSEIVIIRIRVNNTSVLRILNKGFVLGRIWSECCRCERTDV